MRGRVKRTAGCVPEVGLFEPTDTMKKMVSDRLQGRGWSGGTLLVVSS